MDASPVLILQHSETEGPCAIARELAARRVPFRVVRAWRGETIDDAGAPSALIALGGPPCALDDAEHPFLASSRDALRGALGRVPVLGVCLGAQLLAQAVGGRVHRGAAPELGWYDVERTPASHGDPLFDALPARFTPFSWHDDAIELPAAGATLLARSSVAPVQAFRCGERAYGLQFHLELDAGEVAAWSSSAPRAVQGDTSAHAAEQERLARVLFGAWIEQSATLLVRG
jgi:GMP synthase-like glutamine amidotransferase